MVTSSHPQYWYISKMCEYPTNISLLPPRNVPAQMYSNINCEIAYSGYQDGYWKFYPQSGFMDDRESFMFSPVSYVFEINTDLCVNSWKCCCHRKHILPSVFFTPTELRIDPVDTDVITKNYSASSEHRKSVLYETLIKIL